jgi:hypothetical protein
MPTALVGMLFLAAVSALAGQGPASKSQPPASKTETAHLFATTASSATRVAPGGRLALYVDVTPKPKMHLYAPGQQDVIPVSLTLHPGHFKAHAPRFPPPEKYFFQPLNETQLVYSKPFRIRRDITIAPAARSGADLTITGALRYQACDDAICYMPVTVPLQWTVRLGDADR